MIVNRCCMACKIRKAKNDLIRIVNKENKHLVIDEKQNINSRGMYICKDKKCIERVLKTISKNKFKCSIKCDISDLEKLLCTIY